MFVQWLTEEYWCVHDYVLPSRNPTSLASSLPLESHFVNHFVITTPFFKQTLGEDKTDSSHQTHRRLEKDATVMILSEFRL
jgi:hypothetical protein